MLIDDPRFPGFTDTPSFDLDLRLSRLSAAEEFFHFFGVPFDESVMNVNRLHILRRFSQYLRRDGRGAGLAAQARVEHFRTLLARAYEDFTRSSPAREKVFKVFQNAAAKSVSLDAMKASLDERRAAPAPGGC